MKPTEVRKTAAASGSPTLEDVARLAGVSTATVSRCLNAPDRVVERTRVRVLEVVRDLGYAPNFSARSLAAKRTNTIGAIIPTMENSIFARGVQAFQEALDEAGFTLLIASSSYRPDLEDAQIRNLLMRGADALMLIGFDRDEEVYEYLRKRGVPVVISWAQNTGIDLPAVGFDNRAAMAALAHEVFGMGHRRAAVISAPQSENDRARDRVSGSRDAAEAHGLDLGAMRVIETPYSVENGARAMRALMEDNPRPTVVFCGNDVLAVGAVQAARAMGINVPGEVSVTGFDDIELAEIVDPPLTTVHVPHRKMGREAARMIVQMLQGGPRPESVAFDTHIVHRKSLGPAPRS